MVAPIHKDGLDAHQLQLTTIMRVFSPISGIFSATDINTADIVKNRSVLIPDVRVDDYIVDADISRIGTDHYSGSEFTSVWKNGLPPIEWRRYSMSRHRAFGYTIFDEQVQKMAIPNLQQVYEARKMEYTVLRDHDKYTIGAIVQGHMTGKQVARVAGFDSPGPVTQDAHIIAHTGNAADYKWIAEPGETYDNETQPTFAAIQCMELDGTDPLKTVDQLTLHFADNWFDSNTSLHGDRFLLITPALELVFINYLIDKGNGTETAFDMLRNGMTSGEFEKGQAAGYLGQIKGGWKLIKIHPEFLPKIFVDANLVVDPLGYVGKPGVELVQVAALAAYSQSAQTFDYFSERRQEDGGTRFKGTEYVQDMSYDAWVIEQRSEGIIPLILPDTLGKLSTVDASFTFVANQVAAARAQLSVAPSTYPLTGPDTLLSTPEWFHPDYTSTSNLDGLLPVQETGDFAHTNPVRPGDNPIDAGELSDLTEQVETLSQIAASETDVRALSTAYALNDHVAIQGKLFKVTTAGTTSATATASVNLSGIEVGDSFTDGTAEYIRVQ